jgi:P-type conjugative transfer protein TrbL
MGISYIRNSLGPDPMIRLFFLLLLCAACLLFFTDFAVAQAQERGGSVPPAPGASSGLEAADFSVGDGIIERFQGVLDNMADTAAQTARQLLYLLFAVDLVVSVGRGLIGQESFSSMVQRLATRVGFVSVVVLFTYEVSDFTNWLSKAAVSLGQDASGLSSDASPSVSGIYSQGWRFAGLMLSEVSIWKPLSVLYMITAIITLLITGIMMALIVTVYVEMYVVALAGIIVLGFAGLETSKDSATLYVRTLIGRAFKILGLLIIYAMMNRIITEVAGSSSASIGLELVLTIVILQLVTVILLLTVPSSLESLAGGVGSSRVAEIIGGFVAAAVAAPLAKAAIGGGLGSIGGSVAGAAKGFAGAAGGGAAAQIKGALAGAAKSGAMGAGKYAKAGALKGGSLRAEFAKDISAMVTKHKGSSNE